MVCDYLAKTMKKTILFVALIVPNLVFAFNYLGPDLSSWPQNESRKVEADFGAWLLVTPDLDWHVGESAALIQGPRSETN